MFTSDDLKHNLEALGDQLDFAGAQPYELLVIGGAALSIWGSVSRTTKDVDVVALLARTPDGGLHISSLRALPNELRAA